MICCGGFTIRNRHCRRVPFTLAVELKDGLLKRCDVGVTARKRRLQGGHLPKRRVEADAHFRYLFSALRRVVCYSGLVHSERRRARRIDCIRRCQTPLRISIA
jgi:hypothetical protein